MKRRRFIKNVGLGTGAVALTPWLISCETNTADKSAGTFFNKLPLPGQIIENQFSLSASPAELKFPDSLRLSGLGFNGAVPGPTIRHASGQKLDIQFKNNVGQKSIIHWHGLIVPPAMDGHPKDAISNGSYNYQFKLDQRAGTYWYHPHPHKITGEQVYRGLAGFFIIEDEEEKALGLPSGNYEIPLVIQDRRANESGEIVYNPTMPEQMMSGFLGDIILVNGMPVPFHEVEAGTYRLRILNGSNARIYKLAFENDMPITVIGSDGGLLPEAVETHNLLIAPGERADILVDFSQVTDKNRVQLISKPFDVPGSGMMGGMQNMMGGDAPEQGAGFALLEFRIGESSGQKPVELPNMLSESNFPTESDTNRTRTIRLAMEMMNGHTINGRKFEMTRVDERVEQGSTEIWEFINNSNVPHPMHVHAVQFKVLERTGSRGLLPTESGWKDTVLVMPGETVRVIMNFYAAKGLYVYHCHNLEHEDSGMMANMEIV